MDSLTTALEETITSDTREFQTTVLKIQAAKADVVILSLDDLTGWVSHLLTQVCKRWALLCEPLFQAHCKAKGWREPRRPRGEACREKHFEARSRFW